MEEMTRYSGFKNLSPEQKAGMVAEVRDLARAGKAYFSQKLVLHICGNREWELLEQIHDEPGIQAAVHERIVDVIIAGFNNDQFGLVAKSIQAPLQGEAASLSFGVAYRIGDAAVIKTLVEKGATPVGGQFSALQSRYNSLKRNEDRATILLVAKSGLFDWRAYYGFSSFDDGVDLLRRYERSSDPTQLLFADAVMGDDKLLILGRLLRKGQAQLVMHAAPYLSLPEGWEDQAIAAAIKEEEEAEA